MNSINLRNIFRDTWGYVGLPFPQMVIKGMPTAQEVSSYGFEAWQKQDYTSKGVSIYTGANKQSGSDIFLPVWLSEIERDAQQYLLPNTVMSISSDKKLEITELVNRDATVKEEISQGDWKIDIKGVLVGRGNNFPHEEMALLTEWYKKRMALSIQNARTSICLSNDEKVVIASLRFPELRGFENTQPYEIKLISDQSFSLIIE